MAATIEQLLEENLTTAQALQQTSEKLHSAFTDHLVPLDERITELTVPSVESALEHMRTLNELLPRFDSLFDKAASEADQKLSTLTENVTTLTDKVSETEQVAEKVLDELETETDRVFRSVESNTDTLNSELNQIKQVSDEFTALIDEKKDAALKSSDGYVEGVAEAFEELEGKRLELVAAIDKIEAEQGGQLDAMKVEVEGILTETRTELDTSLENMESEARLTYQTVTGQHASQIIRTIDGNSDAALERLVAIDTAYKEAYQAMQQGVETAVQYAENTLADLQKTDAAVQDVDDQL